MRKCRVWIVGSLVFWIVGVLVGQECPSVNAARDTMLVAESGGAATISLIREHCPGAPDSLSKLYHKLSIAAYQKSNRSVAIDWAEKALAVQRELYADKPLGKTLANLGFFYRKDGAFTRALPYLREAEVVFTELGNWRRRHNNRENMVYLWHATGDLGRSGDLLPQMLAEALQQVPGYNRTLAEAETLRLLGVQADESENHAEALPYLQKASPLFTEIGEVMSQIGADMDIARTLYLTEQYSAARQKAQEVLTFIVPYDMPYEKAVLYNLLGLTHTDEGDFELAEAMLKAGIEQALLTGNSRVPALLHNSFSELELARKDYSAARKANILAIGELTKGWAYSEETPLPSAAQLVASEYKVDLFKYLSYHAHALAEGGAVAGAREAVEAGDVTADYLRSDFSGEVSKLFWRKEALPLYELGIRLAAEAGDDEAVFRYLEKSRSVILLEALLEADLLQQLDPDLAGELSMLEAKTNKGPSLAQTGALIALREQIADRNPAARALIIRPEMVDLASARSNLTAGGWDRQLHFFTGTQRTYAFSFTETSAKTVDLGPSTDIAPALRALINFYTGSTAIDKDPAGFLAASHEVYHLLLEPLNIEPGENLLILPDGLLAYLPFNALVTEAGTNDLSNAPYLIRRNQVSYAQSATILDRQMAESAQPKPRGGNLAFAPFITALPGNPALALTYSKQEVEGLEDHYHSDLLEGASAKRSTLLEMATGRALLHLSTHAYANTEANEPPRILTADAPIYPVDVYGLELNADLVILSACRSNIGPLAKGEGVLGLGRAFTAAGARGVIASLWSLNDRATADIVTRFYSQLATGKSKPLALHQAQLNYLDRTDLPGYLKSPYYWAGLTYYGDGAGLPVKGWPWWGWLVLVLGGGAALFGLVRWLGRNRFGVG